MLPLASDENFHGGIVRGLRRREPGLDLVTVQDAGLAGQRIPDETILEWAAAQGRVLLTRDVRTLVPIA